MRLRDGREVRGKISRSDADAVWVESEGHERLVRRNDVDDVTHPGRTEMVVGGILLAAALGTGIAAGVSSSNCDHPGRAGCVDAQLAGVAAVAVGVPGLFLEFDSIATYYGSVSRYVPPAAAAPPPPTRSDGFEF